MLAHHVHTAASVLRAWAATAAVSAAARRATICSQGTCITGSPAALGALHPAAQLSCIVAPHPFVQRQRSASIAQSDSRGSSQPTPRLSSAALQPPDSSAWTLRHSNMPSAEPYAAVSTSEAAAESSPSFGQAVTHQQSTSASAATHASAGSEAFTHAAGVDSQADRSEDEFEVRQDSFCQSVASCSVSGSPGRQPTRLSTAQSTDACVDLSPPPAAVPSSIFPISPEACNTLPLTWPAWVSHGAPAELGLQATPGSACSAMPQRRRSSCEGAVNAPQADVEQAPYVPSPHAADASQHWGAHDGSVTEEGIDAV